MVYGSVVLIYFYFLVWPLGLLVRFIRNNRAHDTSSHPLSRGNTTRLSFQSSRSCGTFMVHFPSCRSLVANTPNPRNLETSFESIYSQRHSLDNWQTWQKYLKQACYHKLLTVLSYLLPYFIPFKSYVFHI